MDELTKKKVDKLALELLSIAAEKGINIMFLAYGIKPEDQFIAIDYMGDVLPEYLKIKDAS